MMKGFITFSEKKVGTFSWELPADLQDALDDLPDKFREDLEQELQFKILDLLLFLKKITEMGRLI